MVAYACVGIFIPLPAPCDKLIAIKDSFDRVAQIPLNYAITGRQMNDEFSEMHECKSVIFTI